MIHEETPSGDPRDPADAAPTPRPVCRRERIWEVIKRPWSTRGGKVVHATLQKPGKPETTCDKTWRAGTPLTIKRP